MTADVPAKPLLLLDVDGPLNPYAAKPTRRPEGYGTFRIRPTGWRERKPLRVWLNAAHGPILTAFAAQHDVELAWATTWEHDANVHIGPEIGLPELPVITWVADSGPRWKFRSVLAYAGDRPVAWFDDDFEHFADERDWFLRERGDLPTLLHHIDPAKGIQQADLDAVSAWLKSVNP